MSLQVFGCVGLVTFAMAISCAVKAVRRQSTATSSIGLKVESGGGGGAGGGGGGAGGGGGGGSRR